MSRLFLLLALILFTSACATEGTAETASAESEAAETQGMADLRSASPEGASIFFVNLEDGQTVESPFTVEFGLEGMSVVPAGTDEEYSGHHHLLINEDMLPPMNMPIPADSTHIHYGLGQTSTELDLPAGEHTLQIILGNHLHIPHDPPVVSEKITITVQ